MHPNGTLRNCPPDFYNNCANAIKKCRTCSAGQGNSNAKNYDSLRYESIDHDESLFITKHPEFIDIQERRKRDEIIAKAKKRNIDREKSRMSRQGRAQEKTSANRLNKMVTQTINSGAVFNDGDLKALEGLIQIDSKLRHVKRSFTVTWDEYSSGRQQGTNTWLITIKDKDNNNHSLACMTEEMFAYLLTRVSETEALQEKCQKLEKEVESLKQNS